MEPVPAWSPYLQPAADAGQPGRWVIVGARCGPGLTVHRHCSSPGAEGFCPARGGYEWAGPLQSEVANALEW